MCRIACKQNTLLRTVSGDEKIENVIKSGTDRSSPCSLIQRQAKFLDFLLHKPSSSIHVEGADWNSQRRYSYLYFTAWNNGCRTFSGCKVLRADSNQDRDHDAVQSIIHKQKSGGRTSQSASKSLN